MDGQSDLNPTPKHSSAAKFRRRTETRSSLAIPGTAPLVFQAKRLTERGVQRVDLMDTRGGMGLSVCPQRGAEVSSLRVREADRWYELLYRGNDWSPVDGWAGRAPWLWPVAGRCYAGNGDSTSGLCEAMDCSYRLSDRVWPMPRHGFVRDRVWHSGNAMATPGGATVDMSYRGARADRAIYPFDYKLHVDASLNTRGAVLQFNCESSEKNDISMPFTFGCHLTFDLRSWWGSDWMSGVIRGLGSRAFTTDQRMQLADPFSLPVVPKLGDDAFVSALIPVPSGAAIRLESVCGQRSLSLSLEVESEDGLNVEGLEIGQPLWVIYRDPQGRFFCCEPWVGWPNAINTGQGRVSLPPGMQWALKLRLQAETKAPPSDLGLGRPSAATIAES